MPLAGHPDDCACCVKMTFTPGARGSRKRPAEEADLTTFLPPREGEPGFRANAASGESCGC